MNRNDVPGDLVTLPEPGAVAQEAATRIAAALKDAVKAREIATLALSGGNTPRDAYAKLARDPNVPWTGVRILWVDERAAAATDDRSNYHWAKLTLLDAAPIPPGSVYRMPADHPDLVAGAREYEATVRREVPAGPDGVPVIDVVVLGVGDDGHTASLFPGQKTVDIQDKLVAAVPAPGNLEARMTLTVPILSRARDTFVLAVGAGKREALSKVWAATGDVHRTPGRVIRSFSGKVTWLVDRAAVP